MLHHCPIARWTTVFLGALERFPRRLSEKHNVLESVHMRCGLFFEERKSLSFIRCVTAAE